jgi:hypothetical protein
LETHSKRATAYIIRLPEAGDSDFQNQGDFARRRVEFPLLRLLVILLDASKKVNFQTSLTMEPLFAASSTPNEPAGS